MTVSDVADPSTSIWPVVNSFAVHLVESPVAPEAFAVNGLPLAVSSLELTLVAAGVAGSVSVVDGALAVSLALSPVADVL